MVHGSLGKQIALFAAGAALIAGAALAIRPAAKEASLPLYSARGDAFDTAVIEGIQSADKAAVRDSGTNARDRAPVRAVVVPHHLVASRSIALGVKALASTTETVILMSPDHFFHCPTRLCTTRGAYQTIFGTTTIDDRFVSELDASKLVSESDLFVGEHGVYTIVPFIAHYLPRARIVPIAVSQIGIGSESDRAAIVRLLGPILAQKGVALVISSDFSHYLPLTEAKTMDSETEAALCSSDAGNKLLALKNPSQSDCPLCLWILEEEARAQGFWNIRLLAHTNSAEILDDPSVKETTSHFALSLSSDASSNSCPTMK